MDLLLPMRMTMQAEATHWHWICWQMPPTPAAPDSTHTASTVARQHEPLSTKRLVQ